MYLCYIFKNLMVSLGRQKNSSDINGDWISITHRDGQQKTHQGMKILCDKTMKRTLW